MSDLDREPLPIVRFSEYLDQLGDTFPPPEAYRFYLTPALEEPGQQQLQGRLRASVAGASFEATDIGPTTEVRVSRAGLPHPMPTPGEVLGVIAASYSSAFRVVARGQTVDGGTYPVS